MEGLNLLEWDSNFFNKKIGAISITSKFSNTKLTEQLSLAEKENYELVYLFTKSEQEIDEKIITEFYGKLVDTKITFKKTLAQFSASKKININSYTDQEIHNDLIELTYLSGKYSRFKTADNFSDADFKTLYLEWMKKSISRDIADEVFVYKEDDKILGFVTVAIHKGIGHIGLVAVNPTFQGKQIGSHLIKHVEQYLNSKKITELRVPTQKMNSLACNFYLKNKFTIFSSQKIYHFSLNAKK